MAKKPPINELICRIMLSRDMAHLEHWKTDSFAKHEALGDFYEGLPGLLDTIVELYQGLFAKVKFITKEDEEHEEELEKITDIVEHLKDDVKWINANRSNISNSVPAIENVIDELISLYAKTLYKLRFLG